MTLLDHPSQSPRLRLAPSAQQTRRASAVLFCLTCHQPFDFAAGQAAIVLKHVAYGYDFVHDGDCLHQALDLLFLEPGYDSAAFARDPRRARVLNAQSGVGCTGAVLALAVVEYRDGSRHLEGIVRDPEWAAEPGGAEFAAAVRDQAA